MDEHQKKLLVRQNLQLQKYLSKAMEYEEKERIAGRIGIRITKRITMRPQCV